MEADGQIVDQVVVFIELDSRLNMHANLRLMIKQKARPAKLAGQLFQRSKRKHTASCGQEVVVWRRNHIEQSCAELQSQTLRYLIHNLHRCRHEIRPEEFLFRIDLGQRD